MPDEGIYWESVSGNECLHAQDHQLPSTGQQPQLSRESIIKTFYKTVV